MADDGYSMRIVAPCMASCQLDIAVPQQCTRVNVAITMIFSGQRFHPHSDLTLAASTRERTRHTHALMMTAKALHTMPQNHSTCAGQGSGNMPRPNLITTAVSTTAMLQYSQAKKPSFRLPLTAESSMYA
jgi:hypothetical protein